MTNENEYRPKMIKVTYLGRGANRAEFNVELTFGDGTKMRTAAAFHNYGPSAGCIKILNEQLNDKEYEGIREIIERAVRTAYNEIVSTGRHEGGNPPALVAEPVEERKAYKYRLEYNEES